MSILEEIYIQLDKPKKKKEHFYVTDLGSCPRKVIMNFGDYKRKELTNAEKIMFFKANSDHKSMTYLLNKSKKYSVMETELVINDGLPKLWHGRLDVLIYDYKGSCMYPIDWKGTRSLRYQADLPKSAHKLQLRSYIMALRVLSYPVDIGKLTYVDRTGSYEGVEFEIEADDDEVLENMKFYEKCLTVYKGDSDNLLPQLLPPIIPREIKRTKDEFHLVPNWQCGYCHYQPSSCKPNMSKNKIASMVNGELSIRKDYTNYANKLYKMIEPKEYADTPNGFSKFINDVNKEK